MTVQVAPPTGGETVVELEPEPLRVSPLEQEMLQVPEVLLVTAIVAEAGTATVRVKVVVRTNPPVAVPVTVIVYDPAGVEAPAVIDMLGLQLRLQGDGEKLALAPVGKPEVEKDTDWLDPDKSVPLTDCDTELP